MTNDMIHPIERITAERIARYGPCWKTANGQIDMLALESLCDSDGLTPLELIERVGNEYGGRKFDAPACVWVLTRPGMLPEEVTEATMVRTVERAIRSVLPICNDPTWRTWADRWLAEEDRTPESARKAAEAAALAVAMQHVPGGLAAAAAARAAAAWAAGMALTQAAWATALAAAAAVAASARAEECRLQVEDFKNEIEKYESKGSAS